MGLPSLLKVGLTKCCPRCGKGALFSQFLKISPQCSHCQLDLSKADSGDGPAVFIIMILGFLVVVQMAVLEMLYSPPIWLHIFIMTGVCLAGAYVMLPFFKSIMVALQYRTGSGDCVENRLED